MGSLPSHPPPPQAPIPLPLPGTGTPLFSTHTPLQALVRALTPDEGAQGPLIELLIGGPLGPLTSGKKPGLSNTALSAVSLTSPSLFLTLCN